MKSEERSQAFLRKRKMLLVLPLLVVPFLTMALWAMGMGQTNSNAEPSATTQGLNLNLPKANIEEKATDKLGFYDKAAKDSIKMAELMRNDPYYKTDGESELPGNELESITETTAAKYNQRLNISPYETANSGPDQKIMQRLAQLEKEMKQPELSDAGKIEAEYSSQGNYDLSQEVDRLESMMQLMNKGDDGDPEMAQLENTLDKILDIQHPDRVKERLKEKSIQFKDQVFTVSKTNRKVCVSLLGTDERQDTSIKGKTSVNGFYGATDKCNWEAEADNAIEAVVHEMQTLVNGSIVKLRLLNDIYIHGSLIPKDNFVFGIASLNGERLEIEINSVRFHQSLYPVKLDVYDLDGLPGIYIPGAITRDVAKQSADNSLQLMELSTMDPSFKAQATAAGIGAAKNLISRKVKLIKVVVKAGYKVLLKDGNQKQ